VADKDKKTFDEVIDCPACGKRIHVTHIKKTVTPAEPAEYEEETTVELDQQTTLAQHGKKKGRPKKK